MGKLLGKTCPNCQTEFKGEKGSVYCCGQCRRDYLGTNKVTVNCLVCQKEVARYEKSIKAFGGACCSNKCQKIWASNSERRYAPAINWERRSEKAKEQWIKVQSLRRYSNNPWRMALRSKLSSVYAYRKAYEIQVADVWSYRIATRLRGSRGRTALRKPTENASTTIEEALNRIHRKREWFELEPWAKKIVNKLSNTLKRRRRKDETKRKSRGDSQEDRGVWTQMCIEWMED